DRTPSHADARGADALLLGRTRSSHPRGTASDGGEGRARSEQGVRRRRVLERGPRVLLRRAPELSPRVGGGGVGPDARVLEQLLPEVTDALLVLRADVVQQL